ncbi:hypothetical protein HanPSC8_Chr14g0631621 [Helianthus annuus]|nr:hypothetical protein HanPSC8_Chr14g0631621 [Helianthus annuus]
MKKLVLRINMSPFPLSLILLFHLLLKLSVSKTECQRPCITISRRPRTRVLFPVGLGLLFKRELQRSLLPAHLTFLCNFLFIEFESS